ncbi:hypothetical protein IMG5_170380 [Ichthyophthirius multifiliis]|uniref:Rab-GAP TBC domain-containing protein n=1 Tax=Ichthyophthirius multifiliis TaxID=5932 RepID=G0R1G3_ICHMU|nr:hypothetical protein IMG5_170380 [Ichthyophthirius multifiliis]EGR28686.1 hypothetical protein IMG5_170380 [Ichthyophthirius multifiliis]|eukprot:XP_004029922.1 hypothetical protein IMG5_170380 [Ichthyophthirius multifiliis]
MFNYLLSYIKYPQNPPQYEQKIFSYQNAFSDFVIVDEEDFIQLPKILSKSDWEQIIKDDSLKNFKEDDIYYSLLKGIPFVIRKDVWLVLCEINKLKQKHAQFNYKKECEKESIYDKQILKDVPRTYSDFQYFFNEKNEGQTRLYRILKAYAFFDPEVGYVQGMNFIVASLLIHMNPENEKEIKDVYIINSSYEENIFWMLVSIMQNKNLRILFVKNMEGIYGYIENLENILKCKVKEVYEHIKEIGLDVFTCFNQYYFTILMYNAPKTFQKRVLDLFLFKGKIILEQIIVKMLKICEEQILQIQEMEELNNFFKKGIMEYCEKEFKKQKKLNINQIQDLLLYNSQTYQYF